jgi:hypothetical protein
MRRTRLWTVRRSQCGVNRSRGAAMSLALRGMLVRDWPFRAVAAPSQ